MLGVGIRCSRARSRTIGRGAASSDFLGGVCEVMCVCVSLD